MALSITWGPYTYRGVICFFLVLPWFAVKESLFGLLSSCRSGVWHFDVSALGLQGITRSMALFIWSLPGSDSSPSQRLFAVISYFVGIEITRHASCNLRFGSSPGTLLRSNTVVTAFFLP